MHPSPVADPDRPRRACREKRKAAKVAAKENGGEAPVAAVVKEEEAEPQVGSSLPPDVEVRAQAIEQASEQAMGMVGVVECW